MNIPGGGVIPPRIELHRALPQPPAGAGAGPSLTITEGKAGGPSVTISESGYPAPWIWGLIEGQRDRVINIDYKPVANNRGNVEVHEWQRSNGTKCILMYVDWRLTYKNAAGIEVTEPPYDQPARRLPVYTRIPYPDLADPQKEVETARRVELLLKAYCYPVVASMDPNQRNEDLWNHVNEVVATKVFRGLQSTVKGKDKAEDAGEKRWTYYGPDMSLDCTLPAVERTRQLIYTGTSFGLAPEHAGSAGGQHMMKINPKFAPILEPPIFGQRSEALKELREMPPEAITTGEIRNHQIDPKDYVKRLQKEIEQEQATIGEVRKTLLNETKWAKGKIALDKKFQTFLTKSQISPIRKTMEKYGLAAAGEGKTSYEQKRHKLEGRVQSDEQAVVSKQAEVLAAPEGTDEERHRKDALQDQLGELELAHSTALKALQDFDESVGKKKSEFESSAALLVALENSMEHKQAQLDKLLKSPVAEGGFDLEGGGNGELTAEECTQWMGTLLTNAQNLERNRLGIRKVLKGLEKAGLPFGSQHDQISAGRFIDDFSVVSDKVERLINNAYYYHQQAEQSHQACHRNPNDNVYRQNHVANLDALHRSLGECRSLMSEVDRDLDAISYFLSRGDVAATEGPRMENVRDDLRLRQQRLHQLQSEISRWTQQLAI